MMPRPLRPIFFASTVVTSVAAVVLLSAGCGSSSDTNDGGGAGDGGAGDGGGGQAHCQDVTHTTTDFTLTVRGKPSDYCVGVARGCVSNWLTVMRADHTPMQLALGCETTCDECQPIACAQSCTSPTQTPAGGEHLSWSGEYFMQSTCGADHATCGQSQCATAAHYVAHMCLYKNEAPADAGAACTPASAPTCTDVEFDWPTNAVHGTL
ncbi:MAG TPA: hypothetical protein VNO21_10685 [Polyangiaceae bacterium]|nr:hypothetical protein [Polyangiaceae bacterium]